MISFCQNALIAPPKFGRFVGRVEEISSFYLFTAAVGPAWRGYGQMFHDFIITEKLGEVYQSPLRPNKAWHPDHSNQVYIWMPDHRALKAWWKVNDPSNPVVPSGVQLDFSLHEVGDI